MIDFAALSAEIGLLRTVRHYGRVEGTTAGLIDVLGLAHRARIGDRVRLAGGQDGEILQLDRETARVLLDMPPDGVSVDMPVQHLGQGELAPDDTWIGRVIDPFGQPLDDRPIAHGPKPRPLRAPPPAPARRKRMGGRLTTGLDVFDTLLPIVRGQRIGLFAGSGVGKTQLLGQLARHVAADVVVLALVGERGRELRDFVEDVLGPEGMSRTVVVAATSDRGRWCDGARRGRPCRWPNIFAIKVVKCCCSAIPSPVLPRRIARSRWRLVNLQVYGVSHPR